MDLSIVSIFTRRNINPKVPVVKEKEIAQQGVAKKLKRRNNKDGIFRLSCR